MMKIFLGVVLGSALSLGVAKAGDAKDRDEKPKHESKDSDCHHGFFHPLQHFWIHSVGGRMSYGLKSFAGNVRHGIGGDGKD